jgi:hypothetical protein
MNNKTTLLSLTKWGTVLISALVVTMTGCDGTMPTLGGASGMTATGGAGGATAADANSQLEHCNETMGTLAMVEDQAAPWWYSYYARYPRLGSTVPVLRMMVQQSNCFVVVERGRAMHNMMQERALQQSGEMRSGSNFGKGQVVAADYTMNPSIQFSQDDTSGISGVLGGLLGTGWGGGVGGGVRGFTDTPEGKVITAAFADSYNQMVKSLRNYKGQKVKGGLGKGGKLKVSD